VFFDYAKSELRAVVAAATGLTPAWARYSGTIAYPWCAMEVVAGPNSAADQQRMDRREIVTVTVSSGSPGDTVDCVIAGRRLAVIYTTNATATAVLLAATVPSGWTATPSGATVAISGPPVFGGFALNGCSVARAKTGDWLLTEVVRRDAIVQVSFWNTNPDRSLAAPNGVDTCALQLRDAIRARYSSPSRSYMRARDPVPQSWAGKDGIDYYGSIVRVELRWTDTIVIQSGEFLADPGVDIVIDNT
jgi:hypothetical protein